jgi:hypothetical protein
VLRILMVAALVSISASADSIAIEISRDRRAVVREHYSVIGPVEFVFLASSCADVKDIELADSRRMETRGPGPWITVLIPAVTAVDLHYQVEPVVPSPRSCAVPILMPKRAVDPVSVTVTDLGSGLSRISVPQLFAHPESKTWTATFPAVPSQVQLEWETGDSPPASGTALTGRFEWNFWGLTGILVTWTVAYLMWARRQAS